MLNLDIPHRLKEEFATVEALWVSAAPTRRVDSLLLSWVKYEKQLRRLFSFFIYQHPSFTRANIEPVLTAFAENRNLNPETFMGGMKKLGVASIRDLLGEEFDSLRGEMRRIRKVRNKLMHGQVTGMSVTSHQLERDVKIIISWVSTLADSCDQRFGYDGLRRNTYVAAKASAQIVVARFPFENPRELKVWLGELQPVG